MDAWDLDFVISGSQKAWMCPPGLVICAIGKRAWSAYDASTYPRFFWDIATRAEVGRRGHDADDPAAAPALRARCRARSDDRRRGSRHCGPVITRLGSTPGVVFATSVSIAGRCGVCLGLADGDSRSGRVSARAIIDAMVANHRVMLQAGQGAMTDQVLRVGHMGWVTEDDLVEAFDALGATLERPEFRIR